jgi:DNA-binding MarR family transcriptional regulator
MAEENGSNVDQIGFLLGRAYYSYIGLLQQWLDESGLAEHLKPGMGSLLFSLFREDGRRLVDVAAELRIAKSTMTGMVARMRDAGLIRLEDDAADGRSWRLWLTPQARRLEPKCQRLAIEMETLLGAKLTATERETLRRALVLVTQTIAERLESPPSTSKEARSGTRSKGRARKATRRKPTGARKPT